MIGVDWLSGPIVWWAWLGIALALALLELFVPGTIFLGFALGAAAMALVAVLAPALSGPPLLALYGFLSLFAWFALRRIFRNQSSKSRIVTKDINE